MKNVIESPEGFFQIAKENLKLFARWFFDILVVGDGIMRGGVARQATALNVR